MFLKVFLFFKLKWTDKIQSNLVYCNVPVSDNKFHEQKFDRFFVIQHTYRHALFKSDARLQFLTDFTTILCHLISSKLESDPDMNNPSIESSHFLFWNEKNFFWFLKIVPVTPDPQHRRYIRRQQKSNV